MRSLLVGSAIIVLTLADFAPAAAQKIHHDRGVRAIYSTCVCHWRYATDNSADVCAIANSCDAEGGGCVWKRLSARLRESLRRDAYGLQQAQKERLVAAC